MNAGEVSSKKYVRQALWLLKAHKIQLKHRVSDDYAQWMTAERIKNHGAESAG